MKSKLFNWTRHHIASNGSTAKCLAVIYAIWLVIIFIVIQNVYGRGSNPHPAFSTEIIILAVSLISWLIPGFISILHKGIYVVLPLGNKKRRESYLNELDERQLQIRQRIFEKSYAVLALLPLFTMFLGFGANISQEGCVAMGYNILALIFGLPSLVAVWDKSNLNKIVD